MYKYLLSFLFLFSLKVSAINPENLTCEYIQNPLGIDIRKPRLSWNFTATGKNQFQSAYEIILSDNEKDIQQLKGTTWSTGKMNSSQSIHIEYSGDELKSFTRYYWKIRAYDQDGKVSPWSTTAWFETAMLNASDWKAVWISDGSSNPSKDEDYYENDPMPLIRKKFSTSKKIITARLFISGLGYYEAYLNGKKISDHVLDPGFTTYSKQVLYSVHDITPMVERGNNTIGFMLGNGWFNPLPLRLFGRIDLREYHETGRPCVKAEIHIRYSDGSKQMIATDESWESAPGPIVRNNVYLGEVYDSRLEIMNWASRSDITDNRWKKVAIVKGPSGELNVQMQPPIRITTELKPIALNETGKDTFIVDMGQNFAGVARIKVSGPAGTKINLRYGEAIYSNGRLNVMTSVCTQIKKGGLKGGPGAPETAWQEDNYIMKGQGFETWSPRFTFHGFRYVEITGWPGTPTLNDITGLRMNTDLQQVGNFSSSNQTFNRLHDVVQWTFLSNVFSLQSDCPAREKMGYGADIVVAANAYQFNYDMANFYRKAVKDFANDQQPDGGITETAPFMGIADKGYGGESGPLGWQLVFPYVQKQLYDFYGDIRVIEEFYEPFMKQMAFLQSKAKDGLFHWDISDHEALDPKPEAFSAAVFYYHHAKLATEFAAFLGKKEDSVRFAKLSGNIRNAIVRKYYVPKSGRFDNATQSAQLFALWYDLSPEKNLSFKVLIDEFERHKMHVSSGIFGVKMMFDVLRQMDRNDLAYQIANQPDYPGWAYMLSKGATTLWETWAYPENSPSQNHPMFGSIDEWFYRSLLGINPGSAGFEKIIIKPQPVNGLDWAKGNYKSVRGLINVDWKRSDETFSMKVSIPVNTKAQIWIPASIGSEVMEGEKKLEVKRYENGYAVIETGSGEYYFNSKAHFKF